jgi:colanic acid/amylovoran biosynthesis protein
MGRIKITLSGVETKNKGAELMLYAILQEIERRFPDAIVYLHENSIRQGLDYIQTNLDLRYKPINRIQHHYERFHIRSIARRLHIDQVHLDDVYAVHGADYFINASGFLVSDQWNLNDYTVKKWNLLLKRNKAAGTKIIFLPQAFGPINKENTLKLLSSINQYADIILPREKVSWNYINSSGIVDMNKVKIFTDFTSLVDGEFPAKYYNMKDGICIIPNVRMVDRGTMKMDDYISLIDLIIKTAQKKNKPIYLLNHEGPGDEHLAYQIQSTVGKEIEVVTGLNALEVKGMISSAYLVISSRFHGVASSLNTCVPFLATSWSHKYEELFNDYKQHDCVLPLDNFKIAIQMVNNLMDENKNLEIRKSLQEIKPQIQNETRKMWKEIWSL